MVGVELTLVAGCIKTLQQLTTDILASYYHSDLAEGKTLQDEAAELETLLEQLQQALHQQSFDLQQSLQNDSKSTIEGHILQAQQVLTDINCSSTEEGEPSSAGETPVQKPDIETAVNAIRMCCTHVSLALSDIQSPPEAQADDFLIVQHEEAKEEVDPATIYRGTGTPARSQDTDTVFSSGQGTVTPARSESEEVNPASLIDEAGPSPSVTEKTKYDWLSAKYDWKDQEDVLSRHQEGTSSWLLQDTVFLEWTRGNIPTAVLYGPSGVGKTILAAFINDHLIKTFGTEDIGLAYAFCDYKQQKKTEGTLIAHLMHQLHQISPRPGTSKAIADFCEAHSDPGLGEILGLMALMVSQYSRTLIVIDGLDEWPERECSGFFNSNIMKELLRTGKLGLLVTSKKQAMVGLDGEKRAIINVSVSPEDIRRFVKTEIEENAKLHEFVGADLEQVLDEVGEKSQDSFLLAHLQLACLKTQADIVTIQEALSALSHSLDTTITNILDAMAAEDSDIAHPIKKMLLCIAFSANPMTCEQVIETTAILSDQNADISADDVGMAVNAAIDSGLLLVEHKSGGCVRLIHESVEEFIKDNHHGIFSEAHSSLSAECIRYLSMDLHEQSCVGLAEARRRLEEDQLLAYAVANWAKHARQGENDDEAYKSILAFITENDLIHYVTHLMHPDLLSSQEAVECAICHPKVYESSIPGLAHREAIFAVSFGLVRVLEGLVAKFNLSLENIGTGITNGTGRTLLSIAAGNGHLPMVRWILGHCPVNLNHQCRKGKTALIWAAEGGHADVVGALLDQPGINPNLTSDSGCTALAAAVEGGYEKTVEILLARRDVNPNLEIYNQTPLLRAVLCQRTAIVRLLLARNDVNLNLKGNGWTPLLSAVVSDNLELVKLLLAREDLDPNIEHDTYGSPLSFARGAIERARMVELLLTRGDINRE